MDELRIDTDDDRVQARGSLKDWAEQATERSEKGGPKSDEGRGWRVCDGRERERRIWKEKAWREV